MIKMCDICDKNYVEETEDICVTCAVNESLDIEAVDKYFIEEEVGEISEEKLNDIGVSINRAD